MALINTRLVRLSDIAAIRPIIDPTAAISDEVHMLDLPSIPRQQAQIMQDHERLRQQAQETDIHVKALSAQVHTHTQALEQVKRIHTEDERKLQDDLERHRVRLTEQLQRVEASLQHAMQVKEDTLTQFHQRLQQRMEEVHRDLILAQQQQNEQVYATLESLRDTIRNQQQELERFQQSLTEQHQDVVRYREDVAQSVERQFHEMTTAIGQYVAEQRQQSIQRSEDEAKREHNLELVLMEVREAHTMLRDAQRHFTIQDQQMQHLTRKLQDETQARKKGVLDLLVLQKHLQVLQRKGRKYSPSRKSPAVLVFVYLPVMPHWFAVTDGVFGVLWKDRGKNGRERCSEAGQKSTLRQPDLPHLTSSCVC